MIRSLGGAIVTKSGEMVHPGAGGAVGGLSEPGRNYGYLLGAGANYYRVDPRYNTAIITPDLPPDDYPPGPGPNGPGTPPIQPNGGAGGGSIGNGGSGPVVTGTGGDCRFNNCTDRGPAPGGVTGVSDLIATLLSSNPNRRESSGPVYLFTQQPGTAPAGGVNVKSLALVGVLAVGAWFAYKKFVK